MLSFLLLTFLRAGGLQKQFFLLNSTTYSKDEDSDCSAHFDKCIHLWANLLSIYQTVRPTHIGKFARSHRQESQSKRRHCLFLFLYISSCLMCLALEFNGSVRHFMALIHGCRSFRNTLNIFYLLFFNHYQKR